MKEKKTHENLLTCLLFQAAALRKKKLLCKLVLNSHLSLTQLGFWF